MAHGLDLRFDPFESKIARQTASLVAAQVAIRQRFGDMLIHFLIHRVARRANGVFDCQRTGTAVGDDRHAVQADQRRAAVLGIVQAAISCFERIAADQIA